MHYPGKKKIFGDEIKINLYENDRKRKRKGTVYEAYLS